MSSSSSPLPSPSPSSSSSSSSLSSSSSSSSSSSPPSSSAIETRPLMYDLHPIYPFKCPCIVVSSPFKFLWFSHSNLPSFRHIFPYVPICSHIFPCFPMIHDSPGCRAIQKTVLRGAQKMFGSFACSSTYNMYIKYTVSRYYVIYGVHTTFFLIYTHIWYLVIYIHIDMYLYIYICVTLYVCENMYNTSVMTHNT